MTHALSGFWGVVLLFALRYCTTDEIQPLNCVEIISFRVVCIQKPETRFCACSQVLSLEKSYNVCKECHLDSVVYKCTRNKMQRLAVISFHVKHAILSSAQNQYGSCLVLSSVFSK